LPLRLEAEGGWADTELPLPVGRWRCVLTGTELDGGVVPLRDLLARFPVALLERTPR
jgi:(1->4)-alpha-D-glucan 1-alpha-D-glucosylmutase